MIYGNCSCGAVSLHFFLPRKIQSYTPRQCDCNFCIEHAIIYLSDSEGKLIIKSRHKLHILQQGSNQAEFLMCGHCKDIIAVSYKLTNLIKAAINATLLKDFQELKEPLVVSPKLLSAIEKRNRWKKLWSIVEITDG